MTVSLKEDGMRHVALALFALAAAGCAQDERLVLRDMGSLHVGGRDKDFDTPTLKGPNL